MITEENGGTCFYLSLFIILGFYLYRYTLLLKTICTNYNYYHNLDIATLNYVQAYLDKNKAKMLLHMLTTHAVKSEF